jgi:hypothetical protein
MGIILRPEWVQYRELSKGIIGFNKKLSLYGFGISLPHITI